MTSTTDMLPLKRLALERSKLIPLFILTILGALLFCLPGPGVAEQESQIINVQKQKLPETFEQKPKTEGAEQLPKLTAVAELKQKAQDAFVHANYAEAAACNLKIAQKYPGSKERHYAVQMLGTIYENNLVDVRKAIKWNREFMQKYADSRQAPFYKEKLENLEKLVPVENGTNQEEAYKAYQKIKFANRGDAFLVMNYEALLKKYPDFNLKVEIQKEIAYAYDRMNKPKESYAALQVIAAQNPGHKLSSTDQIMAEANHSYWEMTTTWKWVAWAVVAAFWGAVLLMKPWKRLDRLWFRTFLIWTVCWVLLVASRMPTFYSMEVDGYQFVIRDTAIYTMAALNLPVILWLMLLTRGDFWLTRPRALAWASPLLTLVMTVAIIYLFVAYQPNGPAIVSVFGVKYEYLIGEFRKGI
jgi:tetratricopeptide (TPR) repeat protein